MKFSYSLRFKLISFNIISTLIPVLLIMFFFISYYRQQAFKETDLLMNNTLKSISQNISSYLSELQSLMTMVGYDNEVLAALEASNLNSGNHEKEKDDILRSDTIGGYLRISRGELLSIIVQNEEGKLQYSNKNLNAELKENFTSLLAKNWFADTTIQPGIFEYVGVHEPNYFTFSKPKRVFSVVQVIKHPYINDKKILILADTDISFYKNILSNLEFSNPSISLIMDENGAVVYSNSLISDDLLKMLKTNPDTIKVNKLTYNIFSQTIVPSGWKVVVLLTDSTLQQNLNGILLASILIALSMIVFVSLIFSALSNNFSNSFREMTSVMKQVRIGNLNVSCSTEGNDEVSALKRSLNSMIEKLNDYIIKEYKLTLSQRNAEYLALQSQIQPHFLYNTLNGFLWLNRIEKREVLENSIINLTGLMRYILESNDIVTIEKELDFLKKYCELQKLRFEDRMNFSISCSDDIRKFKIPKLILQPLVENSVLHAVEPSEKQCSIIINAHMIHDPDHSYVHIFIEDDGEGFDINKLSEKASIGIENVKERLAMTYPDSSFVIESKLHVGTQISIKILVKE